MFRANLAFGGLGTEGAALLNNAKMGILAGSSLSGIVGYVMLRMFLPKEVGIIEKVENI